jgi:hypothetical protein
MAKSNDPLVEGMASTLWGSAWANHAEEHRCASLSGVEITEIMPEIPPEAYAIAKGFIKDIEKENGKSIHALLEDAAAADGVKIHDARGMATSAYDRYAYAFGSDLAFMVTGAGVSWFDDHEEFPLEVPYHEESELQILADEQCEDEGRPQAGCGHYCDPSKKKCPECGSATGFGG